MINCAVSYHFLKYIYSYIIIKMKKLALSTILAAMSSMCFAQDYGFKLFTFDDYPYIMANAMSTDGKYVTGSIGFAMDGTFVFDTETNDMYVHLAESDYGSEGRGVSDEGVAAGFDLGPMTISINGEEVRLEGERNTTDMAEGITPDGTIVVGTATNTNNGYGACYWKDGKLTFLPEPTGEELGLKFVFDDETEYIIEGTRATKISSDGSLILGCFIDRWTSRPCIAWKLNEDGSYTCLPICKGYYEEDRYWFEKQDEPDYPYFQFTATGLSKNGKYIALELAISGDEDNEKALIGRYNIDTEELEVAESDNSLTCSDIADDGTVLASTGTGTAYIWRPDTKVPERLYDAYPMVEDFATLDSYGEHVPMAISPDGRYIMGFVLIIDLTKDYDNYGFYIFDTKQYESDVSGIVSLTNEETDKTETIYSIDGTRFNSLQHGINIVKKNGKASKYLIR